MRAHFVFLVHALLLSSAITNAQLESSEESKAKLRDIGQRAINGNEPKVLAEAAALPPNEAIPFLDQYMWAYREKRNAYYETARKAIIGIPNYEEYYSDKLRRALENGGVDERTFESLVALNTEKAASIAAPYLFEFNIHEGSGDMLDHVNALSAALALGNMTVISDAPVRKQPGTYKAAEVMAWQKWAIDKGLVPRSKKAEVPQWLIEIEAVATPEPEFAVSATVQTPLMPNPMATAEAKEIPAIAETKLPSRFPIVPLAILAAVIVGVVVFLFKRKRP